MVLFIVKTPKRHFLGRKHATLNGRRPTRGATGTLSEEYKKIYKKCSPECTAKIWVVAQTPPGEPIFTKFCMRVRVPDMFLSFEFQKDRMKNVVTVGFEISPLPLKRHIAYTTACCYRTSRDKLQFCTFIFAVLLQFVHL